MKKISFWAKEHKNLARLAIIASYILLNALGIVTGILLTGLEFTFSTTALFCFICLFISAMIAYPSRSQKGKRLTAAAFYIKQKSCDLVLVTASFCMVVYLANRPDTLFPGAMVMNASVADNNSFPKDTSVRSYKSILAFAASMKDESGKSLKWKEKKKLLKEQVKGIRKSKDLSKGEKTILVILSFVVAIGLLLLVVSLSCNLSCSGAEGAAALVGIGGTALVILLLVVALRAIYGKNKKKKQTEIKPASQG